MFKNEQHRQDFLRLYRKVGSRSRGVAILYLLSAITHQQHAILPCVSGNGIEFCLLGDGWSDSERAMLQLAHHLYNRCTQQAVIDDVFGCLDGPSFEIALNALRIFYLYGTKSLLQTASRRVS